MTVCIAAMYDGASVLGASDRMITAGDVQFEPTQPKIRPITKSIALMIAGSSPMQEEILQAVRRDVDARLAEVPDKWLDVNAVAEFYRVRCSELRNKKAETQLLAPLGLTNETFISQQSIMNSELVVKLATELINFRPPDVSAIIVGLDSTGPHIYVAQNTDVSCRDGVGFASIGAGYWHANSQFMFAGHTKYTPVPETPLTIYTAKRRAEVAPGVGREGIDMFFIPALGEYALIGDHVLHELETIYQAAQKKQSSIAKQSRGKIYDFFDKIAVPPTLVTDQGTVPQDGGGSAPPDEKNAGGQPAQEK